MMFKFIAAAGLLALSAAQDNAATASGTLGVQITIASTCAITGNTLNFGAAVLSTATTAAGSATVQVNCTSGIPYAMAIGAGVNDLAGAKRMKSGANLIPYVLTGFAGAATGTGANQNVTINGTATVPAATPAGTYTDTVALTVTY